MLHRVGGHATHPSTSLTSILAVSASSSRRVYPSAGVLVAKEPGFDQQKFGRVDQGEVSFPLSKANIVATDLLRLSRASLISVV
jgi:hypothetical protein